MPITSIQSDPKSLTLTAAGDYAVPIERLWSAWADARQLERFWGPPQWPATFTRHDMKQGGRSAYFMTGPDGQTSHGYWEFQHVDAPNRFEVLDGFAHPDGTPNTELPHTRMSVELHATDAGSRFVATSTFASIEAMERLLSMGMLDGLSAALAQLDEVLAELGDRPPAARR